MCTVTLVANKARKDSFTLTSNRDEAINRETIAPEFYEINDVKMLFPKDAIAGGTWIGLSEKKRVVCLLNGGFKVHERQLPYRMSRGIVVKDVLGCENIEETLQSYNFDNVEPFTLVIADWNQGLRFYEMVWDGKKAHFKELPLTTHIWSSSTLYTDEMKAKRRHWFAKYQLQHKLTPENLLDFHLNAGEGDSNVDLQIDRGMLKTISITQVVKIDEEPTMRYENLNTKNVLATKFEPATL